MKHMRKLLAMVLAVMMVMSLATTAFAQDVGTDAEGKGTITISNAAKGETYAVYKLFDATVNEDGTAIAYTGNIPEALEDYFVKDSAGNISATDAAKDGDNMSAGLQSALTDWAATETPTASATSDGSKLNFNGLDYGYYVVTTTQGEQLISVDSTMPDATVYDKNTKDITAKKEVAKDSYSIGDTVIYTATFDTVNYYGEGSAAKQVIKYTITDTLPEFLSDVAIDSIVITEADGTTTDATLTGQAFNANGEIEIEWATKVEGSDPEEYTSKYDNGAKIIVTYHGTLTSVTNINTVDTNTVKIQPTLIDNDKPWKDTWKDTAEIKTYGAALKKTDGTNALAGAEFTVKGLVVKAGDAAGEYIVVSYDPASTTESATLVTNDEGKLYIVGLASDVTLTVTETKAPDGYNKLTAPVTLTPQLMTTAIYTASGTIYYDADGNVVSAQSSSTSSKEVEKNLTDLDENALEVENNAGTELPSTGGMGTTMFYVFGAILMVVAAVLLVTKRRMNMAE